MAHHNHTAFSWDFMGLISSEPPNSPGRQAEQAAEVKVGPWAHMGISGKVGTGTALVPRWAPFPPSPGKSDRHQHTPARSMLGLWPLVSHHGAEQAGGYSSHAHPSAEAPVHRAGDAREGEGGTVQLS